MMKWRKIYKFRNVEGKKARKKRKEHQMKGTGAGMKMEDRDRLAVFNSFTPSPL